MNELFKKKPTVKGALLATVCNGLPWHCALLQSRASDLLLVLQSKCGRHRGTSAEACEVRLPSLGTGCWLCRKLLAPCTQSKSTPSAHQSCIIKAGGSIYIECKRT